MEYMENKMDDLITGANLQQEESNSFKLISMTDYVLEQSKELSELPNLAQMTRVYMNSYHYAQFLKQPLTLGMFVPCDEEGNVLEKPSENDMECFKGLAFGDFSCDYTRIFEYIEAKERVLFKDFSICEDYGYIMFEKSSCVNIKDMHEFTVERFLNECMLDTEIIYLTENAIKQIRS